ncbi:hypothetical protein ACNHKD_05715 [Methylocystis sp. JAN1]|uniref:hypothetical protein n=1 Tax=Methylocystis sp. JAN1 TaxID=3397211 RepID=UPI003FA238A2
MAVYIFRNGGTGSRSVYHSLRNFFDDPARQCSIWNFSTYYSTKSPDYKLTKKEALSIFCPHFFVGDAPILVMPREEFNFEIELRNINGFAGMLRGKLEKEHMIRLVKLVRQKREKLRKINSDILKLSIYDCIADDEKSLELYQDEINFCDQFIKRHVVYPSEMRDGARRSSVSLIQCS